MAVDELLEDWSMLATAFPFLNLTATLMSGEECDEGTIPIVAICVSEGHARLTEPSPDARAVSRRTLEHINELFLASPSTRERYPFSEETLRAWERKAIEVDAMVNT